MVETESTAVDADPPDPPPRTTTKEPGGYSWFANKALDRIHQAHLGKPHLAILVYVGLVRIASRNGNAATFEASKASLVHECGLTSKTSIAEGIRGLEQARVVKVHRSKKPNSKENEVNKFTLFSMQEVGHNMTKGWVTETQRNRGPNKKNSLTKVRESSVKKEGNISASALEALCPPRKGAKLQAQATKGGGAPA